MELYARGDLGIEFPLEELHFGKKDNRLCRLNSKPVILQRKCCCQWWKIITERAEVTDVYNAVFDGTDALSFQKKPQLELIHLGLLK
jgi:pyruvate kinase